METSKIERRPIQSVAASYLSHRPPEKEDTSVRSAERQSWAERVTGEPEGTPLAPAAGRNASRALSVFIYREAYTPHTSLPFAAQKLAQELPFTRLARGAHDYRHATTAYQKVEEAEPGFFDADAFRSVRA
ncbi:MAG: hypothetical protein AB1781_06345 [Pseudomonadota bacterium]